MSKLCLRGDPVLIANNMQIAESPGNKAPTYGPCGCALRNQQCALADYHQQPPSFEVQTTSCFNTLLHMAWRIAARIGGKASTQGICGNRNWQGLAAERVWQLGTICILVMLSFRVDDGRLV
jgi:hypothetical protein